MSAQSLLLDGAIESIRDSSRQLVRELGLLDNAVAGTEYSITHIHILIELGLSDPKTVKELSTLLNLRTITVVEAVEELVRAGEVSLTKTEIAGEGVVALTEHGRQSLSQIHVFAQDQVRRALNRMPFSDAEAIRYGLAVYSKGLRTYRANPLKLTPPKLEIVEGYQPGVIARSLQMHMDFYSENWGLDAVFEARVASGLADFVSRIDNPCNRVWTAVSKDGIMGTIFIDGEDLGSKKAHLRAFIVDPKAQGAGIGQQLLEKATSFVDESGFEETWLWTFAGLNAARRLYERNGFVLHTHYVGTQWGKEVTEQIFVRKAACCA